MIDLNEIHHIKLFQSELKAHVDCKCSKNSHFCNSPIKLGLMSYFFKLSVLGTEVINVHYYYTLDRELFYCTWAQ